MGRKPHASAELELLAHHRLYFWAALRVPIYFSSDYTLLASGIHDPSCNGVLRTTLPAKAAPGRIAHICHHYQDIPFTWHVSPLSSPSHLNHLLADEGLFLFDKRWLVAIDPHSTKKEEESSYAMIPVTHYKEMRQWSEVYSRCCALSSSAAEEYGTLLAERGMIPSLHHFIGRCKEQAVAVATLFLFEGAAFLHHFAFEEERVPAEGITLFLEQLIAYVQRIHHAPLFAEVPEALLPLYTEEHFAPLFCNEWWRRAPQ